jgi:hypothetical protein
VSVALMRADQQSWRQTKTSMANFWKGCLIGWIRGGVHNAAFGGREPVERSPEAGSARRSSFGGGHPCNRRFWGWASMGPEALAQLPTFPLGELRAKLRKLVNFSASAADVRLSRKGNAVGAGGCRCLGRTTESQRKWAFFTDLPFSIDE